MNDYTYMTDFKKSTRSMSKKAPPMDERVMRGHLMGYLQRNRGKSQYRHAPSAAIAAQRVLRPLGKKFGPGTQSLKTQWPQIVGEKWASLSAPRKIQTSRTDKTLVIVAKGPAAALLSANTHQLLGKINQYLGPNSVTKIKIVQGQINPPKTPTQASAPKSGNTTSNTLQSPLVKRDRKADKNTLESALDKLGQKIKSRNT
jgi:hypothetical protein